MEDKDSVTQNLLDTSNEAELDEAYLRNPFPRFADWSQGVPEDEDRRARELRDEIKRVAYEKGSEALDRALEVTLRAAAVDTGAIEGLYQTDAGITLTIARRVAGWEAVAQAREILPYFEAQRAAMDVVMDLVTGSKPLASGGITEVALKELHAQITSAQSTYEVQTPSGGQLHRLKHGEYKSMPNHVRGADGAFFSYAPVQETQVEMRRLVDELSSDPFDQSHALVQAAYAHYSLVRIHPFSDGNGRVARALASLYLLRAYRVPLVVFVEDRARYLESLRSADRGEYEAVTAFMGWAAAGALELALDELLNEVATIPEQAERLNKLLKPDGEMDHAGAERASAILLALAEDALRCVLNDYESQFHATTFKQGKSSGPGALEGFRAPRQLPHNGLSLSAVVDGPARSQKSISALALVEKTPKEGEPWMVALSGPEVLMIEARRLLPADSRVRRRVQRWAERLLGDLVKGLEAQAKTVLDQLGS